LSGGKKKNAFKGVGGLFFLFPHCFTHHCKLIGQVPEVLVFVGIFEIVVKADFG